MGYYKKTKQSYYFLEKQLKFLKTQEKQMKKKDNNSLNKHIFKHINQAWQGRNRQKRGHHSPSSVQGEWLATDDQKITF